MGPFHSTLKDTAADKVNLRAWFAGYLAWMIALTVAARLSLAEVQIDGGTIGWAVWLFAVYAFYLSLCCTFFPAPTTWMVLLAASDFVASRIGLDGHLAWRLVLVATIGALATGLANLNEYHIFVYLLRRRRIARVRETRLFRWAEGWFRTKPFWILTLFSFIPIPVDVVRWLAITSQYPRRRFFLAAFVGRWFRYAIWAVASMGFSLKPWHIVVVQIVLVAVALARILPRVIDRLRRRPTEPAESPAVDSGRDAAPPPHPTGDRYPTSAEQSSLVADGVGKT